MNIIIYALIILGITYFLLKLIANISSKKISKNLRKLIFFGTIALAILLAFGGKFLLSLPLTLLSLAIVKLKGLTLFQLIALFRLLQTLRNSGRFSFNKNINTSNSSNISLDEAYKILNLDIKKNVSKEEVKLHGWGTNRITVDELYKQFVHLRRIDDTVQQSNLCKRSKGLDLFE